MANMPHQQQNFRQSPRHQLINEAKSQTEETPENKETVEEFGCKKKRTKNDEIRKESLPEDSAGVEAQRKAFGNYLVLSKIMSKLRTTDLITCRLVNSSWKETANSILIKRKDLKAIHLKEEEGKFVLNSFKHHELSELQNILENSTSFPCDDFKIDGPLDHPDLQKFLSSRGGQIRKLDLKFSEDPETSSIMYFFRTLLTQQAVNLDSLILRESVSGWINKPKSPELFPLPVVLQKLSHLEIQCERGWDESHEFPWAHEILEAAPNLRSYAPSSINIETMESLVNLNKSHLLPEMNFDRLSSLPSDERILSQFKLKKLNRDCDRTRFSREQRTFSPRVLNLNVDTLMSISLEFCDAVKFLQTTNVFQHVKIFSLVGLEVQSRKDEGSNKIPLQRIFPNLETIRLEGPFNERFREFHTEDNFPFSITEPMEKVKILQIRHICPEKWLQFLPQVFPNVVNLILENYWDFPQTGNLFWAFTSVKSMDLGTLLGVDNLDSVFTGFSNKTCKRLRALQQFLESGVMDIGPEAKIERLRVAPSIVQLSGLQELRIKVADTELYLQRKLVQAISGRAKRRWGPASRQSNVDLMSPVTSIYAFGMMPSLQAVDVLLTPNETKFLPGNKTDGLGRLQQLAAALTPMAEHPLVTLYPIQMNNENEVLMDDAT